MKMQKTLLTVGNIRDSIFWRIKKTHLFILAIQFKFSKRKNGYGVPEPFRCLPVRELYQRYVDLTMTIEICKRLPDDSSGDCMRQYMMEHTKSMARRLEKRYIEWTRKGVTTVIRFGSTDTHIMRFQRS